MSDQDSIHEYAFAAHHARHIANQRHMPEKCPPKELFDKIEDIASEGGDTIYPPMAIGRPLSQEEWTWLQRRGYRRGYQAPDFYDAPCYWGQKDEDSESPILYEP